MNNIPHFRDSGNSQYKIKPNTTPLSNIFLDFMMLYSLAETRIFLFITRKTDGWHKETQRCSISYLQQGTGLTCRSSVTNAVKKLMEDGWIERESVSTENGLSYEYGLAERLTDEQIGSLKNRLVNNLDQSKIQTSLKNRPNKRNNRRNTQVVLSKDKSLDNTSELKSDDAPKVKRKGTRPSIPYQWRLEIIDLLKEKFGIRHLDKTMERNKLEAYNLIMEMRSKLHPEEPLEMAFERAKESVVQGSLSEYWRDKVTWMGTFRSNRESISRDVERILTKKGGERNGTR